MAGETRQEGGKAGKMMGGGYDWEGDDAEETGESPLCRLTGLVSCCLLPLFLPPCLLHLCTFGEARHTITICMKHECMQMPREALLKMMAVAIFVI
jgi:hypothetical protein